MIIVPFQSHQVRLAVHRGGLLGRLRLLVPLRRLLRQVYRPRLRLLRPREGERLIRVGFGWFRDISRQKLLLLLLSGVISFERGSRTCRDRQQTSLSLSLYVKLRGGERPRACARDWGRPSGRRGRAGAGESEGQRRKRKGERACEQACV